MRAAIKIGLCLGVAFVLVTLIATAIVKTREAAARTQCTNNLKLLGLALHGYHDATRRFPTGTVPNANLPPEKRLSWVIAVRPYVESAPGIAIYENKPWDAPEQCPPKYVGQQNGMGFVRSGQLVGEIGYLICPSAGLKYDESLPCLTTYLGCAGVGNDAAEFPLENVHAGIFGHDRKVRLQDCKHGKETTIMLVESLDGGPWTAGGRATIRGFDQETTAYFGPNGQFASNHPVTLVVLADGSVRGFTNAMSPRAIEAMAALAGDKDLARFED